LCELDIGANVFDAQRPADSLVVYEEKQLVMPRQIHPKNGSRARLGLFNAKLTTTAPTGRLEVP